MRDDVFIHSNPKRLAIVPIELVHARLSNIELFRQRIWHQNHCQSQKLSPMPALLSLYSRVLTWLLEDK